MAAFDYQHQVWNHSVGAESSSTRWSAANCPSDDEGYDCTSRPSQGSNCQAKLKIDQSAAAGIFLKRAQGSKAENTRCSRAALSNHLQIDVQAATTNDTVCSSRERMTSAKVAVPWPAALRTASDRQRETCDVQACCTPSPRRISPRNIFADSSSEANGGHELQQWLQQKEAVLTSKADRYGPAADIAGALPPPAFLLMGLLG